MPASSTRARSYALDGRRERAAAVTITFAKKAEAKPTETPTEAGEDAGNYTITSSIEVGYRGIRVDGDLNKYRSDLNYKAGPRLFDSSFLVRAKRAKALCSTRCW